ncbi:anthranilate phosphoribosyltransferase [Lacticaseibacillus zhaodongensis]|uniref:anthranilate phosphoribosyltransferase n=1 Tax=Lacticaseibacillus zhaodongensis TaxID=2668065 RepID=UPI0012D2A55D|nr:anthranilate phosphoribosyltransferase [Lacticaseibacillus zhaodongensis]
MIKEAIKQLANKEDLTLDQTKAVVNEIMDGKCSDAETAALLTEMHMLGETPDEIAGATTAMRAHALPFKAGEDVLEIVGTGGDQASTFNISTTSAFVVAGAGVPVAKHGNRAASSKSGAADVLEALGVNLNVTPAVSEAALTSSNICFMFAQEYHPAMRFVGPVRKELGIPTIFNLLGPLTNPAHARNQLLGVYSADLLEPLAKVLTKVGVENAMVVHGDDGLDEVTLTGVTEVLEVRGQKFTRYSITPEQFGFKRAQSADLVGGTPAENAQITRDILNGAQGPKTDTVLLNAGCALHVAKPELSIANGIDLARESIASGKAKAALDGLIRATTEAVSA